MFLFIMRETESVRSILYTLCLLNFRGRKWLVSDIVSSTNKFKLTNNVIRYKPT